MKTVPNEERRRLEVFEDQMIAKYREMLCGRHVWWVILDSMKLDPCHEVTADIIDLTKLHLQGDNLEKFQCDWSTCLLNIKDPP